MTGLLIAAYGIIGFAVFAVLVWLTVLCRVTATLRDRPTVRRGLSLPAPAGGWPKLSVIVPAHNEERDIERCVSSLRRQDYPNLEIIFVLDRCTDSTAEIMRPHAEADPRVTIIENDSCPDDWGGKQNAVRVGAEQAHGDYLLFTDADNEFDVDLCRAAVALAHDRDAHLVTVLSTLITESFHERVAQPVATMSLIQIFPLKKLSRHQEARAFANGQFMLFRRDWYEQIGGHAAVKGEVSEDMALARKLSEECGGRLLVLLADGMLHSKMYESLSAFANGWRRIFTDACKRKPRQLRKQGWRVLGVGTGLPALQVLGLVVAGVLLASGILLAPIILVGIVLVGWGLQLASLLAIYSMGGSPRWAVVTYPLGSWFVGRILLRSATDLEHRRPILWGGREYIPEPR